ncbi:MAG: hypothetical protein KJZ80_07345 [Hyphomicrobiaceae bacterium]|nr:hypothetical protein [Hyphomicrobiaceae bacterium]
MRTQRALVIATAILAMATVARSGHEPPVYPSYYPHEIEIAAMTPQHAADLMGAGKLHAYVGRQPAFAGTPADTIGSVQSLGSLVVIRLNPESPVARDKAGACAAAGAIIRDMTARADGSGFVIHPYPVTPWHGDYLYHADLAAAAAAKFAAAGQNAGYGLKVRLEGDVVRGLLRPEWITEGTDWDAAVAEVGVRDLVASSTAAVNGWLGPRWTRSGWFHAYRLLAESILEPGRRGSVDADLARLQGGDIEGATEQVNVERDLVGSLTANCRAVVAGYTLKREYFNSGHSAGIENIAFDALEGFVSPMFLRTVKLKDFPWNGWLQLGTEKRSQAAWNPIGGFTDEFGRLMWFAIGDPAVVPSPYDHGWVFNRISEVQSTNRQ